MTDNYAKPERRPVQVTASEAGLYVLATDGTVWKWGMQEHIYPEWTALPALPQPEEPKP